MVWGGKRYVTNVRMYYVCYYVLLGGILCIRLVLWYSYPNCALQGALQVPQGKRSRCP